MEISRPAIIVYFQLALIVPIIDVPKVANLVVVRRLHCRDSLRPSSNSAHSLRNKGMPSHKSGKFTFIVSISVIYVFHQAGD